MDNGSTQFQDRIRSDSRRFPSVFKQTTASEEEAEISLCAQNVHKSHLLL